MPDSDSTSSRKASTESIEPAAEPRKEGPEAREPEKRKKRGPMLRRSIFLLLCALFLAAGGFLAGRFGCSAAGRDGESGGRAVEPGTPTPAKGEPDVFEVLISGGDILVSGKPVGAGEAAERAASSGLPVRVVYAPDARTSAEDALMRALRKRGVSISEIVRKE